MNERDDTIVRWPGLITPAMFVAALAITALAIWSNRIAVLNGESTGPGILLLLPILWLAVAVAAGMRPLWDQDFYDGERVFGDRAYTLFWQHYGVIGIVVSILFLVQLSVVNDHFDPPGWFSSIAYFVGVAVCGVLLMVTRRTPFRQIGGGLLIGMGLIYWPIVLLVALFTVFPMLVVYALVAVISWSVAKRRFEGGTAPASIEDADLP